MNIYLAQDREYESLEGVDSGFVLGTIDEALIRRFTSKNGMKAPVQATDKSAFWDKENAMVFTVSDTMDLSHYDIWKRKVSYIASGTLNDEPVMLQMDFRFSYDMTEWEGFRKPTSKWFDQMKGIVASLYCHPERLEKRVYEAFSPQKHIIANELMVTSVSARRADDSDPWFLADPHYSFEGLVEKTDFRTYRMVDLSKDISN